MKMKKERVFTYLFMFVLLGIIMLGLYFVNVQLTGHVVEKEGYNQTACVYAEYVWYNETCYDQPPVCANDFLELCLDETNCTDVDIGAGYWYDANEDGTSTCNAEVEPSCSNDLTLCLDEDNCTDVDIGAGYWYNETCYDQQPVCDNDFLELCLNETSCTGAEGHWYDANEDGTSTCNAEVEPSCSNDLTLCDETNCVDIGGGFWYDANEDGTSTCNAEVEPSCSNDLTLCVDETNCIDAGGYWYSDECNSGEETTEEDEEETITETIEIPVDVVQAAFSLSAGIIQPVSISQGGSKEIPWLIKNVGTSILSACKIDNLAEDSWISISDESFNLNPGEQREFVFDVIIPKETEEGDHALRVFLKCSETFVTKDFNINVFKKEIDFELIDVQRTRKDRVRVFYNLEELSGSNQDVEISFSLLNQDSQKVSEVEENKTLSANSTKEFRTTMEINESLMPVNASTNESIESNLTLIVDLNSEIYSSSVQEMITLGAPIGGFAVFEGIGTGGLIAIIVIFISGIVFFIVRRIRKNKIK